MRIEIAAAAGDGVYWEFAGTYVTIFSTSLWLPVPTFHRRNPARPWADPRTWCGQRLQDTPNDAPRGTWLPLVHAFKFARPCARCWP